MCIDHGRADVLVPKEFLDSPDVVACIKQMRGKGMLVFLGKDPLPAPVLRGIGVFAVQGAWHLNAPPAIRDIAFMDYPLKGRSDQGMVVIFNQNSPRDTHFETLELHFHASEWPYKEQVIL
jgi:hypothetical protein